MQHARVERSTTTQTHTREQLQPSTRQVSDIEQLSFTFVADVSQPEGFVKEFASLVAVITSSAARDDRKKAITDNVSSAILLQRFHQTEKDQSLASRRGWAVKAAGGFKCPANLAYRARQDSEGYWKSSNLAYHHPAMTGQ